LWAALAASFSAALFALSQSEAESVAGVGLGKNLNPNRFGNYACWLATLVAAASLTWKKGAAFHVLLVSAFIVRLLCWSGQRLPGLDASAELRARRPVRDLADQVLYLEEGLVGAVLLLSSLAVAVSVDDRWGPIWKRP